MTALLLAAEAPPPPCAAATATVVDAEAAVGRIEAALAVLGGQVLGGAVRDEALMARVERLERISGPRPRRSCDASTS